MLHESITNAAKYNGLWGSRRTLLKTSFVILSCSNCLALTPMHMHLGEKNGHCYQPYSDTFARMDDI